MADKKNAFSIAIAITLSVSITYAAAATGVFNSLFLNLPEGETAPINGTIIGKDNKTYNVLVSSTDSKPNLTLINTAVLDVLNKTFHIVISSKPIVTPPTEPPTTPPPTAKTYKIIMTGDVDNTNSGTQVFNKIKSSNPDIVVVLGDLGYDSSLSWFKSTYGTLGNKLLCVVGNHDAPEDGSSSIYTETKQFCSTSFYTKINKVLLVGVDTNGDLVGQATSIGKLLTHTTFMKNITSVHIMSHKGCAVPPNSHHPVESSVKTFCDTIDSKVPLGVKIFYDQAHNHILASSADLKYKISGAGGRSHYTCDESVAWPFCNDSNYGFLEYTIKPDGTTTHQFLDYNGVVLK